MSVSAGSKPSLLRQPSRVSDVVRRQRTGAGQVDETDLRLLDPPSSLQQLSEQRGGCSEDARLDIPRIVGGSKDVADDRNQRRFIDGERRCDPAIVHIRVTN